MRVDTAGEQPIWYFATDGTVIRSSDDAHAAQYVDDGWWDGSTLAARVHEHALDQPEAIAVVDETTDARVTYSQLWARRLPGRRVPR